MTTTPDPIDIATNLDQVPVCQHCRVIQDYARFEDRDPAWNKRRCADCWDKATAKSTGGEP